MKNQNQYRPGQKVTIKATGETGTITEVKNRFNMETERFETVCFLWNENGVIFNGHNHFLTPAEIEPIPDPEPAAVYMSDLKIGDVFKFEIGSTKHKFLGVFDGKFKVLPLSPYYCGVDFTESKQDPSYFEKNHKIKILETANKDPETPAGETTADAIRKTAALTTSGEVATVAATASKSANVMIKADGEKVVVITATTADGGRRTVGRVFPVAMAEAAADYYNSLGGSDDGDDLGGLEKPTTTTAPKLADLLREKYEAAAVVYGADEMTAAEAIRELNWMHPAKPIRAAKSTDGRLVYIWGF